MNDTRIERITSYNSLGRGIDYYENKKVHDLTKLDDSHFKALVDGSNNKKYEVIIDTKKLKKSTCTCPYCKDNAMKVCKHKVAAYFTIYPEDYEYIMNRQKEYEKECEEQLKIYEVKLNEIRKRTKLKVEKIMNKMTIDEIKEELYYRLFDEYSKDEIDWLDHEYSDYLDYY